MTEHLCYNSSKPELEFKTTMKNLLKVTKYEKLHKRYNPRKSRLNKIWKNSLRFTAYII